MPLTLKKQTRSRAGLALSRKAMRTAEPPISGLVAQAVANPRLISFAAGLVDEASLPSKAAAAAVRRVLDRPAQARKALQYGSPQGLLALRELIAAHLAELEGRDASEMGFSAEDVVVTTGSQQMLYLLAEVLLDEGDIVIAARPSYFVYTGALASFGARVVTVPMDDDGMDVAAVEATLERLKRSGELPRVKFIYCTSYFQNPTGLTLSWERRVRLFELVKRYSISHRIMLVEDAAYRELQYHGEPLASIKSLDRSNEHVVLAQTFSKPFSPGLKLGYSVLPRDLREQVLRQKGNHDFGSANLCQWIICEAMKTGAYQRHVAKLREMYKAKLMVMTDALDHHLEGVEGVRRTDPDGGLYVWLTLPEQVDTGPAGELFRRALQRDVLYVPGAYAFAEEPQVAAPRNQLRLCFGHVPRARIEPGIKRLCEVIREVIEEGR